MEHFFGSWIYYLFPEHHLGLRNKGIKKNPRRVSMNKIELGRMFASPG